MKRILLACLLSAPLLAIGFNSLDAYIAVFFNNIWRTVALVNVQSIRIPDLVAPLMLVITAVAWAESLHWLRTVIQGGRPGVTWPPPGW